MNYRALETLARDVGFEAWSPLKTGSVTLRQDVRDMCRSNSCGQYGKRWSCPPGCGDLEDCARQLSRYPFGILVQTVAAVEDSFDIEAMMDAEARHKARFSQMHQVLRQQGVCVLAAGTGCCTQCARCTYPEEPCRFPEKMMISMEAYGMLVSEVCGANGLPYYYGSQKIAYTSCFLLEKPEENG